MAALRIIVWESDAAEHATTKSGGRLVESMLWGIDEGIYTKPGMKPGH